MKTQLRTTLAGLFVTALASFSAAAAPQLLLPVAGTKSSDNAPGVVTQAHRVAFNRATMETLTAGQEVELALPNGTRHIIVFERIERHGEGIFTWLGTYKDSPQKLRTLITTGPM